MIKEKCQLNILKVLLFFAFYIGNTQNQSNFIHINPTLENDNISIFKVVEDDFGFIWLFHGLGVSKYDGYNYRLITYKEIFGKQFTKDRDFKISKDDHGYIWISSFNGELTRIDPKGVYLSFKNSLKHEEKKQIISFTSKNDYVWFGSKGGSLYNYNYNSKTLDSVTTIPKYKLIDQEIVSMTCVNDNEIWLSTNQSHVYKYSVRESLLTKIEGPYVSSSSIFKVSADHKNQIWIATERQGLFICNAKTNHVKPFKFPKNSSYELNKNMFLTLFCDSAGFIWAGTDGDGLYRINPDTGLVNLYEHNELNDFSLRSNTVIQVNEDSHKNIWVITKANGIEVLPNSYNEIKYHGGNQNNSPTRVLSMLKASDGTLWIGTDGKGLNKSMTDGTSFQYGLNPSFKNSFQGKFIQSLVEDVYGNIWIGTYQNGLWLFDKNRNSFIKFPISDSNNIQTSDVRFLFRDSKNRIWVSTDIGIYLFSSDKNLLVSFKGHDSGIYGDISQSICEDENGTIWVGINLGGLFEFKEHETDIKKSSFKQHLYFEKIKGDSDNYNIASMVNIGDHIWIVTVSGALIKFNYKTNTYESFSGKEDFKNISFSAILVEDKDNIWLSSNKGIIHYNIKTNLSKSYYQTDGLQGNNFLKRSSFKDTKGYLYFGGINGLNYFLPANLQKQEAFANLYISNIEILNQPAQSIISDQLTEGIMQVEQLKLKSEQSSFSFQFSALANVLNPNFHYAYRLKGFNNDWIVPKSDRVATYTNIQHGSYEFEVKAGSKKGTWDVPLKSIKIIIMPPWWLSKLAYTFYGILGLLLFYGVFLWLRLKSRLVKEEWEHHKEKELYALKMNFFTKMSHEIQTPLTLILGPIEDMLKNAEDKGNTVLKRRLSMISNNAKRLSRIAMELTSTRNKELGQLKIKACERNLIKDLKNICVSFEEQASFREINFIQKYPIEPFLMWYDSDMIEHVIYNLLSNAFKFTPREGNILMTVEQQDSNDQICISITDSGPGIPNDELEKIFVLFYQSEVGKKVKGTGIGLALTKEIVELHHGQINVTSSQENGTCFTVYLSTNEHVFSESEKIKTEPEGIFINKNYKLSNELEKTILDEEQVIDVEQKTLLIVEDNYEMQIFLRGVFSDKYKLLFADNGKEGIVLAEKNNPHLIISDVMMPEIDGIEMCKILQKKKSTLHIPIILLSARNKHKIKIEGLRSGAVEYMHKPFNIQELILKVNNFITRSGHVISKYKTELLFAPKNENTKSVDDLFLEQLVQEISEQLDNTHFKLEDLSKSMNMSYSAIYRKCQSITGKTLVEFVRLIRIKKASILFLKYGYGISEAAYMVGFNNPKYFSKCFRNEFGTSPNKLKKKAQEVEVEALLKEYKIQI